MKKIKKALDKTLSPPSFSLFSADALHPVDGILPPARGAGASGASNSQSYNLLLQRVFACFLEGDDNPSGPAGQLPLYKGAFFTCFSGKLFVRYAKQFPLLGPGEKPLVRYWVQGRWPCWVQGRCPWWVQG